MLVYFRHPVLPILPLLGQRNIPILGQYFFSMRKQILAIIRVYLILAEVWLSLGRVFQYWAIFEHTHIYIHRETYIYYTHTHTHTHHRERERKREKEREKKETERDRDREVLITVCFKSIQFSSKYFIAIITLNGNLSSLFFVCAKRFTTCVKPPGSVSVSRILTIT